MLGILHCEASGDMLQGNYFNEGAAGGRWAVGGVTLDKAEVGGTY